MESRGTIVQPLSSFSSPRFHSLYALDTTPCRLHLNNKNPWNWKSKATQLTNKEISNKLNNSTSKHTILTKILPTWTTWQVRLDSPPNKHLVDDQSGVILKTDLSLCARYVTAVYFEQGEYKKAIETCEKAVDEGRDKRADFKLIAK